MNSHVQRLARIPSLAAKATSTPAVLALSAILAQAAPITVPNGSFESPTTSVSTTTNDRIIPGWVFVTNDKGFTFGTEAISKYFTSTAGSDGNNFAFIENDDTFAKETITSAAPLATIAPLTTYTLTVAIGNVKAPDTGLFSQPGNMSFSLLANGTAFATKEVPNNTVANGTWEDFTLTYTTSALSAIIGENLTIQLASLPQTAWGYEPAFDNVQLDATDLPVPEPTTVSFLMLGSLALAAVLLRRRHLTTAVSLLFIAATATGAIAAPITIPNASFENPTTPTGGDGAPVPGWVFNSASGNLYGTSAIVNSFRSEGAASGNNYAFLINDGAGKTNTITSAASLGIIEPNTSYTLSVAVGNVAGSDSVSNHSPGNVSFSLLANGVAFATDTVPNGTVPDGTFEDFSLTFQTPSTGTIIGENLEIQLASLPTGSLGYGPAFDNVTLDATSIAVAPEPPAWALLVAGGLSLAWLMRRPGRNGPLAAIASPARQ